MRGLFPLSAYSPNKDAQTGTKRGGERPQEPAKASTQNRANTPKSLTAQMEPRYYGQVPFRGCSLMVKPQSSKLITRVRFPSSPPLRRLRRKRRGLLRSGDDGNRFRAKIHSLARSGFSPSSPSSPRELVSGNPFRMRICFLARSESARSSSSSPPQILSAPSVIVYGETRARIRRSVGHLAGKQVN